MASLQIGLFDSLVTNIGTSILKPFMPKGPISGSAHIAENIDKLFAKESKRVGQFALVTLVSGLITASRPADAGASTWVFFATTVGGLLGIGAIINGFRAAVRTSRAVAEAESLRAGDPKYSDAEAVRKERMALEEDLFRANLKDSFELRSFHWRNIDVFQDGYYVFAPRMNVLLGKNGYGKTLLLRTLVAMLQRDHDYSTVLFPKEDSPEGAPILSVEITRNGEQAEQILRDSGYFREGTDQRPVGKVPVLAIPDTRFVDRSTVRLRKSANTEGLAIAGAKNFLAQLPFDGIVQDLLFKLGLDYYGSSERRLGRRRPFERGIFRLVEEVVAELTDDIGFRFSRIKRVENDFEIYVRTAGSQDLEIPIQSASQGTLSVLAIFGLIYSFLRAIRPEVADDEVCSGHAIVFVDEIDAHLHPRWQQKIIAALAARFPNVQFIVTGHSPLIVAGCDRSEVSVLRRRSGTPKFFVETIAQDFMGAQAEDLYKRVFELEENDRLYLEYSAKTPADLERQQTEIDNLQSKDELTPEEDGRLLRSLRERRLIRRAEQVQVERKEHESTELQLKWLNSEIELLRHELRKKGLELEMVTAALATQGATKSDGVP